VEYRLVQKQNMGMFSVDKNDKILEYFNILTKQIVKFSEFREK